MIYGNAKRVGTFVAIAFLLIGWYVMGTVEFTVPINDIGFAVLGIVVIPFFAFAIGSITIRIVSYISA